MKGQKQLLAILSASMVLPTIPGMAISAMAKEQPNVRLMNETGEKEASSESYGDVISYYKEELLGNMEGLENDADLQSVVKKMDTKAKGYLDTMLDPSSSEHLWDDQAYNDAETGAKATESLDRLKMIAIQINEPTSEFYQDEDAKAQVIEALRFILDKKYGPDTVKTSSNWWDWEIGAPKSLVDTAILLYDDLDEEMINDITATVDRFVPKANYRLHSSLKETGANLIDKVAIVIKRAALDGNEERLAHAKECMAPLFSYSSSGDGYYPDGSFIQHGNIPYNGSYGYVLLNELTNCIIMLNYTDYAIDEEDIAFYENTLINHYLPFMSYGGNMVDSVRGRAVSRKSQQGDTMGMQTMGVLLQYADTAASEETKKEIYTSLKPIAEQKFASEEQTEDFSLLAYADYIRVKNLAEADDIEDAMERNSYNVYYNMDRIVAQRDDFTFTVAANSKRMVTEQGNSENLLGRYQGQGYTQLYNDDINQYNEDYNATVDQKRLTGVTTAHQDLGFTSAGQSAFSGGTTLDGENGVSGFELTGDKNLTVLTGGFGTETSTGVKSGISAKKSYFVFGDKIVYLGSGITNSNADPNVDYVETIVENRKTFDGMTLTVNGEQKVSDNGSDKVANPETAYLSGKTTDTGIGYVFLEDGLNLDVKKETRSGTWNDVNKIAKFTDYTPVSNDYISMAINHGDDPANATYAWVTLANVSEQQLADYAANPTIKVLENTSVVQGVYDEETKQNAFNFFAAGRATLDTGETITVSGPASIIVTKTENGYDLAVSDPSQANSSVEVTIDGMSDLTNIGIADGNASVVESTEDSMTVRVNFSDKGATEKVSIGVVYATTSENLALNKTAKASSVVQNSATAQRQPKFAVDGNRTTRWAANYDSGNLYVYLNKEEADTGWLAIDLGETTTFNQIKIFWELSVSNDYEIQISNDESNDDNWDEKEWTSIYHVIENTGYKEKERTDDIVLDNAVTARYVRMKSNLNSRPVDPNTKTSVGLSIYEFEVYNSLDLERSVERANELLKTYDDASAFATPGQYQTLKGNLESALQAANEFMNKGNEFTEEDLRSVTTNLDNAITEYDKAVLHVESIAITGGESITLDRGETTTLEAVVTPENAYLKDVTWKSSDTSIAKVDENGVVTGVSSGTVTITATSKDSGVTATKEINVVVRPKSITLNKEDLTLKKGESETLTASVSPVAAGTDSLVWASSDDSVVTVENGKVTAVGVGEEKIIVFSNAFANQNESPFAVCDVTVEADLVIQSQDNLSLKEGTTATASSTVKAYGTGLPIKGVSPQGAIDGTTDTRWASDYRDMSAEQGNDQWLQIEFQEPQTFNHIDIVWHSPTTYGKEYKILVSMDGENWTEAYHETDGKNGTYGFDFETVTAKYVKFQGIKRTLTDGGYGIQEFRIFNHLNGDQLIAQARELMNLYPTELTGDAQGYEALKQDVEDIEKLIEEEPQYTQDDLRPLLENLQSHIVAYSSKIVKVSGIEGSSMSLKEKDQAQIEYTINPSEATNQEVAFENKNPDVVSIDEDGTITALKKGIATVVVTTVDGNYEAEVVVSVRTDTAPTINASDITIEVGKEFNPLDYASAVDEEDGTIVLTMDNVVENTVDTAQEGEGIVTYQVEDCDGNKVTKTIRVTVKENAEVKAARNALEGSIQTAKHLDASQYTKDSYAKLEKALREAEEIVSDPLASKDELEKAQEALEQAIDQLEGVDQSGNAGENTDEPTKPGDKEENGKPSGEETTESADTGVEQGTMMASWLALLSGAGIAAGLLKRKKRRS